MTSGSSILTEENIEKPPAAITDVVPTGIEFISDYDASFPPAVCNPLEQTYDDIDTMKKSKAGPVKILSTKDLKNFSETLPFKVQHALTEDLTGKINPTVLFHGELVLHHVIPHLVRNNDLYAEDD